MELDEAVEKVRVAAPSVADIDGDFVTFDIGGARISAEEFAEAIEAIWKSKGCDSKCGNVLDAVTDKPRAFHVSTCPNAPTD